MRVLYAGCNLFGQIVNCDKISFADFVEFDVENLDNFAIGHSVIVLQVGNDVYLHGHGLQPQKTHTVTKLCVPSSGKIEKIVTTDTRVMFLDDLGEVFVLDFVDRNVELQHRPGLLGGCCEEDDRITKFAAGIAIKVAVSRKGKVLSVPNELVFENEKIVQVCAGNEHCLLLDGDGNVFSFGKGNRGQLGHCTLENQSKPKMLEALAGLHVIKISCGNWHSCALSDEGDLYLWGWNSNGQLGLFEDEDFEYDSDSQSPQIHRDGGDEDYAATQDHFKESKPVGVMTVPTILPIEDDEKIINVGCGSRHTVFVNDKNEVHGCGCNKFNQLALREEMSIYRAVKIHELDMSTELHDIVCGPAATSLLFKS